MGNFLIKSFIKYPDRDIRHFEEAQKNPQVYFVDINNSEQILKIKDKLDFQYLYGVIYIAFGNQVLLDFALWDLVDPLWSYFLNLIEDFLRNKKAEIYFSDQPVLMRMEAISDQYMFFSITVDTQSRWKVPRDEFLNALLHGAKDFFEKSLLLFDENDPQGLVELKRIKQLEQKNNKK